MNEFCYVCEEPVKVPDTFDPQTQKALCSPKCYVIETLFTQQFSDEEIYRRRDNAMPKM